MIAHAHYRIGGGEDRYIEQQRVLLQGDHDVHMLTPRNEDLDGGLETARRLVYSRRNVGDVVDGVERIAPDVIHLHNPYPALGPAIHVAARRLKIPLVQTVHNHRLRCPNGYMFTGGEICTRCEGGNHTHALLHPCFPTKQQAAAYATALWTHRFAMKIDDAVSRFIAPSRYMADRLRGWGYPEERIAFVSNFTDATPLPTGERGSGGIYVGRLSPEKGLSVLLEALGRVGDPPFVFVGGGPSEAELREGARRLGLSNCRFEGVVDRDRVVDLLQGASYFVLPSQWNENAPLALMEAMVLGLAPIVARRGGLPELAEGRGMVVEPEPGPLADALSTIGSDPDLAARLGRAARDFAVANLDPASHKESLNAVYASLVP